MAAIAAVVFIFSLVGILSPQSLFGQADGEAAREESGLLVEGTGEIVGEQIVTVIGSVEEPFGQGLEEVGAGPAGGKTSSLVSGTSLSPGEAGFEVMPPA